MNRPRRIPIKKYMTRALVFASPQESVLAAYGRMQEGDVRHLPVVRPPESGHGDEELLGVLFKSDLKLIESLPSETVEKIPVSELMVTQFYTVDREAALDVVAREMSKRKFGSALVVEGGKVVGVFTTTDALRALSDALTDSIPESLR